MSTLHSGFEDLLAHPLALGLVAFLLLGAGVVLAAVAWLWSRRRDAEG